MSRILVVEDEKHLAEGLRFNLEAEGYQVEVAETGEAALDLLTPATPPVAAASDQAAVPSDQADLPADQADLPAEPFDLPAEPFDLMVLDVMLPGKDGFTVMSEIREAGQFIPTLMLTARGHPGDVLQGFAAGADDYLAKPFDLPILVARIRGLLRRRQWLQRPGSPPAPAPPKDIFTFGDKSVDFTLLQLRVRDQIFPLTLMEGSVLRFLIQHENQPVPRKKMLEEVWGLHEDTDTRAIDNFIVRLRRYIEDDPTRPRHLLTLRGVGYRFVASPPKQD